MKLTLRGSTIFNSKASLQCVGQGPQASAPAPIHEKIHDPKFLFLPLILQDDKLCLKLKASLPTCQLKRKAARYLCKSLFLLFNISQKSQQAHLLFISEGETTAKHFSVSSATPKRSLHTHHTSKPNCFLTPRAPHATVTFFPNYCTKPTSARASSHPSLPWLCPGTLTNAPWFSFWGTPNFPTAPALLWLLTSPGTPY